MNKVTEMTVVIKLHKPVSVNQPWPDTIYELLYDIGQIRYDDTEIVGFSVKESDD